MPWRAALTQQVFAMRALPEEGFDRVSPPPPWGGGVCVCVCVYGERSGGQRCVPQYH